ncbi:MAG: RagB/SusD family nutrient uptake outer membrane protein [Bacteroidota bacterium]
MKQYNIKIFMVIFLAVFAVQCESVLEETVFSELAPGNFLKTEEGINSLLFNAYSNVQVHGIPAFIAINASEMPAGRTWNRGGSIETRLTPLTDYTWDSNHNDLNGIWTRQHRAIRDVNLLLDNLDPELFSPDLIASITAQCKFIRAKAMMRIYDFFGPGPLFISSENEELKKPKASEAEYVGQIITDMTDAMNALPVEAEQYGRATKGAAAGLLCKFYLNQKDWTNAASMAKTVMDLGVYGLFPDYLEAFAIDNEGNEEMVYVHPHFRESGGGSNRINALTFPTDYPRESNQGVWAARTYFFDSFVDSYHPDDTRKEMVVQYYISSSSGDTVWGYGNDQSIPIKYQWDPEALNTSTDSDFPEVRYADILLSRAEALNEMNGPSQEAIDLINLVRDRAGVPQFNLGDYGSKEALRDAILQERAWEFAYEGKSRQDQIRHGVMISRAQARGKNAQNHHVKYAIPQQEIDANPNIQQNEGY